MPPKFFITHSWHDIDFARKLCNDLRANGLEGFLDERSIRPGESIPSRIERGLKECDVYIPVFSPDALKSSWCDWEIDVAITMNRKRGGRPHIIPVIAKPCEVPERLCHLLYINFVGRYEDALDELLMNGLGVSPQPPLSVSPARRMPPLVQPTVSPAPVNSILPTVPRTWRIVGGGIVGILVLCLLVVWAIGQLVVAPAQMQTRVAQTSPTFVTPTRISLDSTAMVYVPAGEFLMGSNDDYLLARAEEMPQHQVYLDEFWIDKFEVTNTQFAECLNARICTDQHVNYSATRYREKYFYFGVEKYNNYPVIYVSWEDAEKYCEWKGKRLPTEAEWEKAARGTDGRIYPWGNTFDNNKVNADNRIGDTTEVGSYPSGASPYSAMDMAGNVWEWVADWFDSKYYATQQSSSRWNLPTGPSSGLSRILRGGSWDNASQDVSTARRVPEPPNYRSNNVGFRCAQ